MKPTKNAASKPLVPMYPSVKNRPTLFVNGSTATSRKAICEANITDAGGIWLIFGKRKFKLFVSALATLAAAGVLKPIE